MEDLRPQCPDECRKDGLEYFAGELLDQIAQREAAAERLHKLYDAMPPRWPKTG